MTSQLSIRKLVALAALAVVASLALFAQPAATQGPAAPYITQPGIDEVFVGGAGRFTVDVFCGPWKGIVQFTAGIGGKRYVTRTIYVCDSTETARVSFKVRPSHLGPHGNYQYKIKVGRHDAAGNVVRWTHSLVGSFNYS
jgi:hypothetical protein